MVLIGLAIYRFQMLIQPLVIAAIIAYLLNPVIKRLAHYTPLSRGATIGLVYTLFALIVLGLMVATGVTLYRQTIGLVDTVEEIIREGPEQLAEIIQQPVRIGPWTFEAHQLEIDLNQATQQLFSLLQPLMSRSARVVGAVATATVSWVGWAILIFVLSIYLIIDLPRLGDIVKDAVGQPGYYQDVDRLLRQTGIIWHSYLRGQTILAVTMAVLFTIVLTILGVRYSLVLGLLAGVLDYIPYVGPITVVTLSTLVALFQGGNWLGLSPIWFGLIVLLAGVILQQVEGNWLNPRILGEALGLNPMLVMIAAIMGGSLAGILGMILAAPVLATLKLLGTYTWRKMLDLEPFPEPEALSTPPDQEEPAPAEESGQQDQAQHKGHIEG